MVREVHHHVGVGIIESEETKEFLFGVYDDTFPKIIYQGRINFIGGNHDPGDSSPLNLFQREINEEFKAEVTEQKGIDKNLVELVGEGIGARTIRNFAPEEDIEVIRESILTSSKPFKDYFITVPAINGKLEYNVVYSVFLSKIPQESFEIARKNLYKGKSIKCGGLARISSAEEISKGVILNKEGTPEFMLKKNVLLAAAGTPVIMQDYLGIPVSNPESIRVEPLDNPRPSFKDYFAEFIYTIPFNR